MKSAYYDVRSLYSQAVKQTPFCRSSAFMHTRHAKADGLEGTLIIQPDTLHLPQLILSESVDEAGDAVTMGHVRIYDVIGRVVWDGVFNYTLGDWESWRINRWRNSKGRGDLLGNLVGFEPLKDIPMAWLTHDGRGATVTYTRNSLAHIGYDGVNEDGILQYVYLTRDKVLLKQHAVFAPDREVGDPLDPCFIVPDADAVERHRRLEWGRTAPDQPLYFYATAGGGSPINGFRVGNPEALPHYSLAHYKDKRDANHTPLQEAFWLAHYPEGYAKRGQVGSNATRHFSRLCVQYRQALLNRYPMHSPHVLELETRLHQAAKLIAAQTLNNVLKSYGPESAKHTPALLNVFGHDTTGVALAERSIIDEPTPKNVMLEGLPFPYNLNPDTGYAWIDEKYENHPDFMVVYARINEHHNRGT